VSSTLAPLSLEEADKAALAWEYSHKNVAQIFDAKCYCEKRTKRCTQIIYELQSVHTHDVNLLLTHVHWQCNIKETQVIVYVSAHM